jgi:hypothetical protein
MSHYTITVSGCDDSTSIVIKLSDQEHELLVGIAGMITAASQYACMPRMKVETVPVQKEPT